MSNANASDPPPESVWIYHERQEALLCGQHALNNLVQSNIFSAGQLAEVAHQLDALELNFMAQNNEGGIHSKEYRERLQEGSVNVDERGNFSIQVLKRCMDQFLGQEESLPHYTPAVLKQHGISDVTQLTGFLCHKSDHWFAIRNIAGRFFNLNSTFEKPVVISHFQLGTEMEGFASQGYTVFCVMSDNLPKPFVGPQPPSASSLGSGAKYHSMALLLGGNAPKKDPWQSLTGSGMRLDGKATQPSASAASGQQQHHHIEGLTEEEQIQLAMQLSETAAAEQHEQDQQKQQQQEDQHSNVVVPPEPPEGTPNVCRIQFRFPGNGKRVVRRFAFDDTVAVLFAYSRQECDGRAVELRAGFPPKDLSTAHDMTATLQQANLIAGESIQVRFV